MFLLADYPGMNGFLGTRGSLMLDLVTLAMILVVPVLAVSVYLVRVNRQYNTHKWMQIALGVALLLAVLAFEIDMRMYGWEERAKESPYFDSWVRPVLWIHLCCAVPTALLWIYTIVQALRFYPDPPTPGTYSLEHARWGWASAIGMFLTALTGWIFYYLAFVATK